MRRAVAPPARRRRDYDVRLVALGHVAPETMPFDGRSVPARDAELEGIAGRKLPDLVGVDTVPVRWLAALEQVEDRAACRPLAVDRGCTPRLRVPATLGMRSQTEDLDHLVRGRHRMPSSRWKVQSMSRSKLTFNRRCGWPGASELGMSAAHPSMAGRIPSGSSATKCRVRAAMDVVRPANVAALPMRPRRSSSSALRAAASRSSGHAVEAHHERDRDVMVVERVIDPLQGGIRGDDRHPIAGLQLADHPGVITSRFNPMPVDFGPQLRWRAAPGWTIQQVDLPDPSLDVLFAEEAVEEDEPNLHPHAGRRRPRSRDATAGHRRRRRAGSQRGDRARLLEIEPVTRHLQAHQGHLPLLGRVVLRGRIGRWRRGQATGWQPGGARRFPPAKCRTHVGRFGRVPAPRPWTDGSY